MKARDKSRILDVCQDWNGKQFRRDFTVFITRLLSSIAPSNVPSRHAGANFHKYKHTQYVKRNLSFERKDVRYFTAGKGEPTQGMELCCL